MFSFFSPIKSCNCGFSWWRWWWFSTPAAVFSWSRTPRTFLSFFHRELSMPRRLQPLQPFSCAFRIVSHSDCFWRCRSPDRALRWDVCACVSFETVGQTLDGAGERKEKGRANENDSEGNIIAADDRLLCARRSFRYTHTHFYSKKGGNRQAACVYTLHYYRILCCLCVCVCCELCEYVRKRTHRSMMVVVVQEPPRHHRSSFYNI